MPLALRLSEGLGGGVLSSPKREACEPPERQRARNASRSADWTRNLRVLILLSPRICSSGNHARHGGPENIVLKVGGFANLNRLIRTSGAIVLTSSNSECFDFVWPIQVNCLENIILPTFPYIRL
jgi:hypothetical protein